jgi:molecular chaperone DnaK (HSP70)
MTEPRYAVGIDLGTTHSAVAAAPLDRPAVRLLAVPRLVAPGESVDRVLLPSFLYLTAAGELPEAEAALPWGRTSLGEHVLPEHVVGELAQRLGAKSPNRLVASAKSWVCHGGVNRRAPILPWNSPEDQPHVSPFDAQVAYLGHMRAAWEARYADAPLREQDVVVTVPASFDEGARELTTSAARAAGLGDVRLLEEPQAAFYDYLGAHADELHRRLGDARLILVVDVGGGTTDLTLLRVIPGDAGPKIERIAVGGHLMLGGDNMDAALATFALHKAKIERPGDASVWSATVQSARQAKEKILAAEAPAEVHVTHQARGSRLVAGTRSIPITREEALEVILEGFLPRTGPAEVAQRASRAGLTTLGLPYATDVAIGRHVCAFLRRHTEAAIEAGARIMDGLPRPDLLLLNGGVFNAPAMVERLSEVLEGWYGGPVPLLEHTSLDTAVARGAVRSILARRGIGESIGGGTARAYYIGVEAEEGRRRALCIAPRAMDDGASVDVPDRMFSLVLDRPVAFPLYAYTGDRVDPPGAVVEIDDELEPIPALETVLRAKDRGGTPGSTVPVTLAATMTETGALELYLRTVELPPSRWKLDFVLGSSVPRAPESPVEQDAGEDAMPEGFGLAAGVLARALDSPEPAPIKGVRRDLEKGLGPRGQWSLAVCRALWQVCMDHAEGRARSEVHELNWMRLVGWCLRPGFGADGDDDRIAAMWGVRDEGLRHRSKANWAEWWILWRRISGGLDATRQLALFEEVRPYLWPGGKPPPGPHRHGPVEMMQLLGVLERLAASHKATIGDLLVERASKIGSYWPLGRVGARCPVGGDQVDVVEPVVAHRWLESLLRLDWETAEGASFAAASIARMAGDPARDIDAELRRKVVERLTKARAPAAWIDMVLRPSTLSAGDLKRVLGEGLPVGLRLH